MKTELEAEFRGRFRGICAFCQHFRPRLSLIISLAIGVTEQLRTSEYSEYGWTTLAAVHCRLCNGCCERYQHSCSIKEFKWSDSSHHSSEVYDCE